MSESLQSGRRAAIFWDIENTMHGLSARRGRVGASLVNIGNAIHAYLHRHGYEVSKDHQVVVTVSREHEAESLVPLGFTVRRIDRHRGTVEDDLTRTVSEASDHSVPALPPLVILVSGDKALTPLVEHLRGKRHTVWVISWRRNAGASLKRIADRFFPLENLLRALERKPATP